jgi:hypothetical protein
MEQLQSHVWLTASSPHIWGNICAFPHILESPSSYDFAAAPLWISIYMRKIRFSFLSVCAASSATPSCGTICIEIVIIYYFSRYVMCFLRHMLNLSVWQLVLLLERNITAEDWTRIDQIGIQGPYLYTVNQECLLNEILTVPLPTAKIVSLKLLSNDSEERGGSKVVSINNYRIQIIETAFAEYFLASHCRMGSAQRE